MKHLLRMLVLVVTAAGATTEAGEYWSSCNSCSAGQVERAAWRVVPERTIGRHDVYVADFDRETIRKYTVLWEFDGEFREWEGSAWLTSTEPHIEYEFAQVVNAMKADIASVEPGKLIPGSVVDSAYELLHNSFAQQQVADYIIANMSLWESIGAPVFVPLSLFRKIVDLNLTISVVFADGSTAQFVLTGVKGSLSDLEYVFELVDGSARDADGNVIPENTVEAAPFTGEFSSEPAAQRMLNFIEMRYSVPTGPFIKCYSTQVGNNITVTCKRH